jgi:mannose-6-phosphate isomerase-like protein (cupin superfamily)
MSDAINLQEKLSLFADHWRPKVIAELNDYQIKLVKISDAFVWHKHDDTDELFLVVDGTMKIDLRDRAVTLGPGELFVVPKGVEHRPSAAGECHVMLIEPRGVVNTGDAATGELTAPSDSWI